MMGSLNPSQAHNHAQAERSGAGRRDVPPRFNFQLSYLVSYLGYLAVLCSGSNPVGACRKLGLGDSFT